MKSPTELMESFRDLSWWKAQVIKRLCALADKPEELENFIDSYCPGTSAYARQCYTSPYNTKMWRRTMVLHAVNDLIDGHGVEPLGPMDDWSVGYAPPYEYVNMGDSYSVTLIYDRDEDSLTIGSWGDIAEAHPEWES